MNIDAKKIHFDNKEKLTIQIEMETIHDLEATSEVLELPIIKRGNTYYIFYSHKVVYFYKEVFKK